MLCLRNAQLETLPAGLAPATRTADYSDIDARWHLQRMSEAPSSAQKGS